MGRFGAAWGLRLVLCLMALLSWNACGGGGGGGAGGGTTPPPIYTVTFLTGAGGSLVGPTTQTVASGGSCMAVTAIPDLGYTFTNWMGTGFTTSTTNPLVISNVTQNLTLSATFTQQTFTVSFVAGTGGGLGGTTSQTVAYGGSAAMVSASANGGYTLLNWTGTGGFVTSTANPLTVASVTSDMVITANFTSLYVVTFVAGANGTVSGTTPQAIATGGSGSAVTAIPNAGYAFTNWTGTGGFVTTAANPLTVSNVNATTSLRANFSHLPVIGSFWATSTTIGVGQQAVLNWSGISNYTSASIDNGGGAIVTPNGMVAPYPAVTTTFTLTLTNAVGTNTAAVTITVVPPPSITSFTATPSTVGAGANTTLSWSVTGATSLNPSTGVITGTPTFTAALNTYVVRGTNSYDFTQVNLVITVDEVPPAVTYSSNSYALDFGVPVALAPINTGGPVTTWTISPALPAGLAFNTSNGQITGTPTSVASVQGYTISATNAGGTGTTSPVISVAVQPPIISVEPYGRILSPGDVASFSVTASGTGVLSYQWCRDGDPIGGATLTTYTAPAFAPTDDGAVLTVVVSDGFGGNTTSSPAVLSLFQDLATWLTANPAITVAIKWQTQSGDPFNHYIAPSDAQKLSWSGWSPSQQADLNQAYLDHVAWYNAGAPQVAMVPGGTPSDLTDQPTNIYSQVGVDTNSTMVSTSPAYMWRLYTGHVAFSLMLETSHQVPWSITGYNADSLRWLFDSSTMAWRQPNGDFGMGTYSGANQPTLRNNNRPRTDFTDPRWTYPWLKQTGIIGGSRLNTIGGFLDYMRQNLYHVNGGADTFGSDFAIWQYRGYSPVSKIVLGTVDGRYPGQGTQHYTEGCHGSTGFLNAALRVVNIPVQPIWICGHELVYFMSEDLYLDHADDPYNAYVRASNASSLLLLIDSATWRSRFGTDETLNIWDYASPAGAYIGYTAAHFP